MGASKRSLKSFSTPNIVGKAYQELKTYVERYAGKKFSVLFVGKSGYGKIQPKGDCEDQIKEGAQQGMFERGIYVLAGLPVSNSSQASSRP